MSPLSQQVQEILREFFEAPDLVLTPDMVASDVEGWDSLAHLDLMATIEERFGVKFTLAELSSFRNVGDLLDSLARRIR